MKDIIKYLRHYIKESILAPLFKMLEASFELFVPLVMAAIIDTGIKNSDKPYIFKMGMVLVGLAIVGFISALTAQYFAAKAAVGFGKELRGDLYRHINTLSYSEIDKIGTSTLITRLTADVNQMQTAVKTGGIIDGISTLLDTVVNKVQSKGLIDYNVARTIKEGKNIILKVRGIIISLHTNIK